MDPQPLLVLHSKLFGNERLFHVDTEGPLSMFLDNSMHMVHISNRRCQQNPAAHRVVSWIPVTAGLDVTVPTKSISLQQFEAACRAQGLPVTVQRRCIFEALLGRTDHPTPDQVYAAVKDTLPGVSRTTVYRVLDTLVRVGVLAKACSPSAASRVDPRTSRHHHLVCQRCERLVDLDDAAVPHRIRPPDVRSQGFTIADYSIYFTGLCAQCQAHMAPARRAARAGTPPLRPPQTRRRTSRRSPRPRG